MGRIFGAFTDISWKNNGNWKDGNGSSFIFSLRDDFNFVKLKHFDKFLEVYHSADLLTCVGYGGSGFFISDECNINTESFTNLGMSR